jgi:hypothetical protein
MAKIIYILKTIYPIMAGAEISSMFQSLATHQARCETAAWYGFIVELKTKASEREATEGLEKIAGDEAEFTQANGLIAVAGEFTLPQRNAIAAYLNSLTSIKGYHAVQGSYYDFLSERWPERLMERGDKQIPVMQFSSTQNN